MTITFPLTMPGERSFANVSIRANNIVEANPSPFTGNEQFYEHQGNWWTADIVLPPLKGANAARWQAFLTSLRGRAGTFLMGDPSYSGPRGAASGAPQVNGAGQTGNTLVVDGWTPSVTGILLAGDRIGMGSGSTSRMHMVLQDVNSNGSGQATLDIWPRLSYSPADNTVLEVQYPRAVFRLLQNDTGWGAEPGIFFSMSYSAKSEQ